MNIIDALILLLIYLAVRRGMNAGILRLFLSALGFIGGLFLGSVIAGSMAPHVQDVSVRFLVVLASELLFAMIGAGLGELLSIFLQPYTERFKLTKFNRVLGGAFEAVFVLLAVWLLASIFSGQFSYKTGTLVQNSAIIRTLNATLPPAPDVLARLERVIAPNGFPKVFIGQEPRHRTVTNNANTNDPDVIAAEKSVLMIEGYGCGGLVEGSGFVAAPGYVVTNAHVVAGVRKPKVITDNGDLPTTVVYFDKSLDLAILKVPGIDNLPVLPLNTSTVPDNTPGVVLGYPGGGGLTLSGAVVLDKVRAVGRDIYNRGIVSRDIHELQSDVEPGNSGGPLIDEDGKVLGVVFAKSVAEPNVGYAFLSYQIQAGLAQAQNSSTPVATGRCAAE